MSVGDTFADLNRRAELGGGADRLQRQRDAGGGGRGGRLHAKTQPSAADLGEEVLIKSIERSGNQGLEPLNVVVAETGAHAGAALLVGLAFEPDLLDGGVLEDLIDAAAPWAVEAREPVLRGDAAG